MSTEAAELAPPPTSVSDSDQLKASFNAAAKAEGELRSAEAEPEPQRQPPLENKQPEQKVESIVPKELIGQQEEKKDGEEPLVSEEVRSSLKGAARQNFEKLESAAKTKIEALRKELAEAKSKTATPTDVEPILAEAKAAKERAAQLESEFERVAYTQSPKYQRFGNEEGAEIKSAKSYLEGGEVNPAIIDAAANTQGAARMKILRDAGVDAETIAILSPHLARVDAIRRERDQSLEGWKANLAQDQQRAQAQQQQQEQQRIQMEKTVFTEVMGRMKTLPAFTRVDGNEKWNALVDQNYKEAEEFAQGRKPLAELFELGFNGVANKTTHLMNQELTKQLNEANTKLSRLMAAQPGVGRSVGESSDSRTQKPKTDTEHFKSAFNESAREVAANGFNLP